jgi:hypothetical protein
MPILFPPRGVSTSKPTLPVAAGENLLLFSIRFNARWSLIKSGRGDRRLAPAGAWTFGIFQAPPQIPQVPLAPFKLSLQLYHGAPRPRGKCPNPCRNIASQGSVAYGPGSHSNAAITVRCVSWRGGIRNSRLENKFMNTKSDFAGRSQSLGTSAAGGSGSFESSCCSGARSRALQPPNRVGSPN